MNSGIMFFAGFEADKYDLAAAGNVDTPKRQFKQDYVVHHSRSKTTLDKTTSEINRVHFSPIRSGEPIKKYGSEEVNLSDELIL